MPYFLPGAGSGRTVRTMLTRIAQLCSFLGIPALLLLAGCNAAEGPGAQREHGGEPVSSELRVVEGQLTGEGVECPALRGDDGQLYTLLGDLGGFAVGDRVRIEGEPVEISFCMQGTTLKVHQIAAAEGAR